MGGARPHEPLAGRGEEGACRLASWTVEGPVGQDRHSMCTVS